MAKTNVRINRSIKVESSFIESVDYDTDSGIMIVNFKTGGKAAYKAYGWEFSFFGKAGSVGKYYNKSIKRYLDTVDLDDLNIGWFEDPPQASVFDRFPIGTPVKVTNVGDDKYALVCAHHSGESGPVRYPLSVLIGPGKAMLVLESEVESLV